MPQARIALGVKDSVTMSQCSTIRLAILTPSGCCRLSETHFLDELKSA